MLNSPDDALEYIKPFVPNDIALARSALQRELSTSPDWVIDGILFLLVNTLMASSIKEFLTSKVDNHWMKDTIPHLLSDDINPN